mmetsp:Transcript_5560/g.9985  ORF Transcript_5560/g.9985 Transcript_5560/m.9985 type:complete len:93 (+) Transcript_5560:865-1143(+)
MVAVRATCRLAENATNPTVTAQRADELRLKYKESLSQQMVREANKDRLEQLLREVQHKSDDDRYVAALDGQSLGTHSVGSTAGAKSIQKTSE